MSDARPTPSKTTDLGNAERFVRQHGERVRHIQTTGDWRVWDGKRWALDRDGEVERLATKTVRSIYREAAAIKDHTERLALAKHARDSESRGRISALLGTARTMRPIAVVPEVFDPPASMFLLNVLNGTLDLRTGELRPQLPEDHITRLAPVTFDAGAQSELWERFLDRQVPDTEVRDFLQRAVGYSLTGDTGEEVLFFMFGPEAAGKSTFVEAIKATLGDYAVTTPFATLLRRRGDHGPRDDFARLPGARMALAQEVDEGRAFDVSSLKALTGGDSIACRPLYGRYIEFRPAFKLWLAANHRPQANAQDGALWRRVLTVPFQHTVPEGERDPALKARLTQDANMRAAVLAWAVVGCLEWQRGGLRPPAAVRRATADYREACDDVGRFLADCYAEPPDCGVSRKDLRGRYKEWCGDNGEKELSAERVGEALRLRGFSEAKVRGVRFWRWPQGAGGRPGQGFREPCPTSTLRVDFAETLAPGCPLPPDESENGHE